MSHEEIIKKAYYLREKEEHQGLTAEEELELSQYMNQLAPSIKSDMRIMLSMNENRMDKRFKKAFKRLKK